MLGFTGRKCGTLRSLGQWSVACFNAGTRNAGRTTFGCVLDLSIQNFSAAPNNNDIDPLFSNKLKLKLGNLYMHLYCVQIPLLKRFIRGSLKVQVHMLVLS